MVQQSIVQFCPGANGFVRSGANRPAPEQPFRGAITEILVGNQLCRRALRRSAGFDRASAEPTAARSG